MGFSEMKTALWRGPLSEGQEGDSMTGTLPYSTRYFRRKQQQIHSSVRHAAGPAIGATWSTN
jgi:hypothetical protein